MPVDTGIRGDERYNLLPVSGITVGKCEGIKGREMGNKRLSGELACTAAGAGGGFA